MPSAPSPTRSDAEQVGVVALVEAPDPAVAGDDLHADDGRGDVAVGGTRAVSRRGDRSGDRLRIDVAEVGHREAALGELVVQVVQPDPGLDGDVETLGATHTVDAVEIVEGEQLPVGHRDVGEGVCTADHLDALTGLGSRAHDRGHLGGRSRLVDTLRDATLIPGPVLRRHSHGGDTRPACAPGPTPARAASWWAAPAVRRDVARQRR